MAKKHLNIRVNNKYEGLIEQLEDAASRAIGEPSVNKFVLINLSRLIKFKPKKK
jgi:hypothetical protein